MRIRCNVVIQTSVDDTTVVLIYTVANWIQVHVNFMSANPEWACSDDLSVPKTPNSITYCTLCFKQVIDITVRL